MKIKPRPEKNFTDFDDWLKSHRKRDENVIKGEKIREEIREEIKDKLSRHFGETEDQTWCKCDTCTLIRLKAEGEGTINSLALIGLQFLLGQNFNGAAALYYHTFYKERQGDIDQGGDE
jgi:hypothetical protein